MHTKDILLMQTTAGIAVLLITYIALVRPERQAPHRTSHIKSINLTTLIACPATPSIIHIHIFANDARRLDLLVRALDAADYGPVVANITVLGDCSLGFSGPWQHGGYSCTTPIGNASDGALVIVFDDFMEPSPMYALWFLVQRCAHPSATAVAGGGSSMDDATGLAMTADVWNGFVAWGDAGNSTAALAMYIESIPNASVIFPSLESHTFVREEWQNPYRTERPPKLMRSWDPERTPQWKAAVVGIQETMN